MSDAPRNQLLAPGSHGAQRGQGDGKNTYEVLVLDDSSFDQSRIKRSFGKTGLEINVTLTAGIDEFEMALNQKIYDVILIDYNLPKGDGLSAQNLVNEHPQNKSAGVVMISSEMRTDVAVETMKNGSIDCLEKDALNPDKLKEIMMASAQVFSEASRHWIGDLLEQQRQQISQDIANLIRHEMGYGKILDTIDNRVAGVLEDKGMETTESVNMSYLLESDEPLKF